MAHLELLIEKSRIGAKSQKQKSMRKLPQQHHENDDKLKGQVEGWLGKLFIIRFYRLFLRLEAKRLTERDVKWQSLATKDKRPNFSHNNTPKLIRVGKHK